MHMSYRANKARNYIDQMDIEERAEFIDWLARNYSLGEYNKLYFADEVPAPTPGPYKKEGKMNPTISTELNTLNMENTTNVLADSDKPQRSYLLNELSETADKKKADMEVFFGMTDDPEPKTAKEMVERIQANKIILQPFFEDGPATLALLQWRDPERKRDEDGFNKALEAFETAKTRTRREIVVKKLDAGLESLLAFEGTDFTKTE